VHCGTGSRTFDFAQTNIGVATYARGLHANKSGNLMKPTIAETLKFALTAGAMVAAMAYITSAGGAVATGDQTTKSESKVGAAKEGNVALKR
jgi:hypothetical protein